MKIKTLFIVSLIVASTSSHLFAQVNLQTGAAQYNLPLFSYSDQNKLATQIELNYVNGNGLRVNEAPSEVGSGWQLMAGGVIVRQQRGLPDDQKRDVSVVPQNPMPNSTQTSNTDYVKKYYPNGYLYSAFSASDILTNEAAYTRMFTSGINGAWFGDIPKEFFAADREQDIFSLNIEGEIIEFVIDKNLQVRCLGDEKYKIQFYTENMYANNVKTTIGKFIVTAATGIQYIFEAKEYSEECTYDKRLNAYNGFFSLDPNYVSDFDRLLVYYQQGGTPPSNSTAVVNMGVRTGTFVVTKWFLSEIKNPATTKKITFSYDDYDLDVYTARQLSFFNGLSLSLGREILKTKRLTKIDYPDQTEISFSYDPVIRVDVPNKPLKEIIQKKNGIQISKNVLEYGYFFTSLIVPYDYAFTADNKFMARLCLKSIQRQANNDITEPPYTFEYYTGTAHLVSTAWDPSGKIYVGNKDIVPPMYSYFTDHWGYYNILQSNRPELYKHEGPPNFIPKDYHKECDFATNYKIPENGMAKNGILKSVKSPMGGYKSFEYEQNSSFYNGQNVASGGVRVSRYSEYDGIDHSKDIVKEFKYLKEDNTSSSGWGYEPQTYSLDRIKKIYSNAQGKTGFFHYMHSFAFSSVTTPLGSFRVSKGALLGTPFEGAEQILAIIIQYIIDILSTPPPFVENSETEYYNSPQESANPLQRLYSRVEVVEKVGSTTPNGSIIYSFNSDSDLPLLVPVFEAPYSMEPRTYRNYYGQLKSIRHKDVSGNIVKEIINEYNLVTNSTFSTSLTHFSTKNIYDAYPATNTIELNQTGNIISHIYGNASNYVVLKNSREKMYKPGISGFTEKFTEYTYNTNNLKIAKIKTTDSRGSILETKNFYPNDYNLTTFPTLQAMVNANIINVLISSEVWKTKLGGTPELLSATVTEYGQTSNGDYNPIKTYALESETPVAESVIGQFNSSSLVRNATLIKSKSELTYHYNGWPGETKAVEGNVYNSFMYGYNDGYQIADIANARLSEVAFSSFEETVSNGGWLVSNAALSEEYSPTGRKCLQLLEGGTISTPIPMTKNYILSFWANAELTITGSATLVVDKPTINGWTYYEYLIPSGSASPVINGNSSKKIDELRLYPENARINTTTYDPGIGKTSECDINNRITYYTYDKSGRLSKVFDENHFLIKTYEYHYKSN